MNTPRMRSVVRGAVLIALTSSAGCATTPVSHLTWEGTPRTKQGSQEQITVFVENMIWNDMVIYSQSGGSRTRLGVATTGLVSRFQIPQHQRYSPDLELIADPIGSSRLLRSGPVVAGPGQVVRWVVHENAAVSALTVW